MPPKIRRITLDKLTPDPKNANRGTDRGRKALASSLTKYGAMRSITLDKAERIMAGNKTVEQARAQGYTHVLIVPSDGKTLVAVQRTDLDLTTPAGRAAAIADNRTSELDLDWDPAVLEEFGKEADLNEFWDEREWLKLAGPDLEKPDHTDDELAAAEESKLIEAQKKWKVALGDKWAVTGKQTHTILCGDSSDLAVVARLGKKAPVLLFTSPPYSDQRKYRDAIASWSGMMTGMWAAWFPALAAEASILVNLGMAFHDSAIEFYWNDFLTYTAAQGSPLFGWYVWDKMKARPGDYHGRLPLAHEFVFHWRKGKARARKMVATNEFDSGRAMTKRSFRQMDGALENPTSPEAFGQEFRVHDSIFRAMSAGGVDAGHGHPAPFSKAFAQEVIRTFSDTHDTVADPFLGSGTTIVACDEIQRHAVGVDLAPEYVAIALERLTTLGMKCARVK